MVVEKLSSNIPAVISIVDYIVHTIKDGQLFTDDAFSHTEIEFKEYPFTGYVQEVFLIPIAQLKKDGSKLVAPTIILNDGTVYRNYSPNIFSSAFIDEFLQDLKEEEDYEKIFYLLVCKCIDFGRAPEEQKILHDKLLSINKEELHGFIDIYLAKDLF